MLPAHQDMRAAAARAEQAARAAAEAEAKRRDGDLWKSVRKLVGSRAFQARSHTAHSCMSWLTRDRPLPRGCVRAACMSWPLKD